MILLLKILSAQLQGWDNEQAIVLPPFEKNPCIWCHAEIFHFSVLSRSIVVKLIENLCWEALILNRFQARPIYEDYILSLRFVYKKNPVNLDLFFVVDTRPKTKPYL